MNYQEADVLRTIYHESYKNQRILSELSGYSLGVVNRSIKALISQGYLNKEICLTSKALELMKENITKNAIILAAGYGMRMVPINSMMPKGLLEVHGEPLIERLIKQIRQVGIEDIMIVVGFMKERYDYLIDKYKVQLIVNMEYAKKNNLASLAVVADHIANTYIIPCDIWAKKNPFSKNEMYSWYMVSDSMDVDSEVRINRKMELVSVPQNSGGNTMVGISYITQKDASVIREKIMEFADDPRHDDDFWEAVLFKDGKMSLLARIVSASDMIEVNTYEQLRELDGESNHLKAEVLDVIATALSCRTKEIVDIKVLKKGMTNRSFLFSVDDRKYIMRIPGEGTELLINRAQEAEVFRTISGYDLCDDPVFIDPDNGYKITRFLEGARVCDPQNDDDITQCMDKLRYFHSLELKVDHLFDIFAQIVFYEKLWNGIRSAYRDYEKTKENVLSLKAFIDTQPKSLCLTHIDAVPDNFLFYQTENGIQLQLTDWEYAGMQDPHVDLAMFAIYSYYDKKQVDRLLNIYFGTEPGRDIKAKIYCYIAACGLLWSNWTEYKSTLGIEFGEYGLRQYRYAKEYYCYAKEEMIKE